MLNKRIIAIDELRQFGSAENLNQQAVALVKQQQSSWVLASKNYEALNEVQNKEFDYNHFRIIAQYNPGRYRSSAARTDAKSIAERACFLCPESLPEEQKGILFKYRYLILTNPFPIFPEHLTITGISHIPQHIPPFMGDMLDLAKELNGFTVFYNGPMTGASAPDHFHFQAGTKNMMPTEQEIEILEKNFSSVVASAGNLKIFTADNYLRRVIVIAGDDKNKLVQAFEHVYALLGKHDGEEPMMNILCSYENKRWKLIIFPRRKQRPSHFSRKENPIVVGPASVECGGLLILPKEENFLTITKDEIAEIYEEITIKREDFSKLTQALKKVYS